MQAFLKMFTTPEPFAHVGRFLATGNYVLRCLKLIKRPAFYRSNSLKKDLEFKTKNIKMKLSLESGDDFMKTMLSWIACGLCLDHENTS